MKKVATAAALLMAIGVIIGAFGAHGLKDRLSQYGLEIYEKAVFYHFIHALGMLILPSLVSANLVSEGIGIKIAVIFGAGVFFFSGSLYALALTELKWLGAITPIGGTLFIVGWFLLAWNAASR